MYAKRYNSYFKTAQPLDDDMIDFSNSVVNSIGVDYPVNFQFPIVEGLATTQFLSLFLDQVSKPMKIELTYFLDFCWSCCYDWSFRCYFDLYNSYWKG